MRIKFGNRFPFYLTDLDETEKKYFLQGLTQQCAISDVFLKDVKDAANRNSIALKLWVGATTAAKSTRITYNIVGGQQSYDLRERIAGFEKADDLAINDEIVRTGVEVAPIVELLVRSHNAISLEGSDANSPIRKYVKKDTLQHITSDDLRM